MGRTAENQTVLDNEYDNENTPPTNPTTPVLANAPRKLLRKHPLGTRIDDGSDDVYKSCLKTNTFFQYKN